MTNIKRLAAAALLGLSVCGLAVAQVPPNSGSTHDSAQHHGDPDSLVQHFTEVFPQVAAFDRNKDGKLDSSEKQALGKAIVDGKLQLPAHMPEGAKPNPDKMLNHIAEMYAWISTYDVNRDGKLDKTEQAALKRAIENGEFPPHAHPPHEAVNPH